MLGNDVVDLGDAETRDGPSHPRFDARVFAPSELARLATSADPNRVRWMLWAAKEATYKLGVKRAPELVFAPARFIVALDSETQGCVRYPGGLAHVRLCRLGDSIHALATEAASDRIVAQIAPRTSLRDTSYQVRALARERVAARLGVAPSALRIASRGRVPTLEFHRGTAPGTRTEPVELDLSLSHHGRYLAFACDLGGHTR
jgi:phosphopantetheinyl transferase (holo-ACP synthase)